MGTTVSSLHFLGVSLEDVQAALPHTLVGQWSERFVTACPDVSPRAIERKASTLSKQLACTVLLVSMFDGDVLWLTLYQDGKRLTGHVALSESCKVGNLKLFCSSLGLPEKLAPKLKRLFTDCLMQEEKLSILQDLLGAPLFLRWDSQKCLPAEPIPANDAPLETWLREHPAPSKIKNQCKAELLQEIPDRSPDYGKEVCILRPVVRKNDQHKGWYAQHRTGDILGYALTGGEWVHPLPSGEMEQIPLIDPPIPPELRVTSAPDFGGDYSYAALGRRLVTADAILGADPSGYPGAYGPVQTVIVHDTAGILPCPLPLTLEGCPAVGKLTLLPDGGFLVSIDPKFDFSVRPPEKIRDSVLACYGPDGTCRWDLSDADYVLAVVGARIYAISQTDDDDDDESGNILLCIDMDGQVTAQCTMPFSSNNTRALIFDGVPYLLEPFGSRSDDLLHRLTPDLKPDGEVRVPSMSSLAFTPDGSLLYAAGFQSGLRVIDGRNLHILQDQPRRDGFFAAVADSQNRLWTANSGCFECYTPELELISRHRLKGSVYSAYRSDDGRACALTFQDKKCIVRVYRFS